VETAIAAEAAAATDGAISAPNGSRPTARPLVGQHACAARPREATDGADGRVASEAGLSNLYKGVLLPRFQRGFHETRKGGLKFHEIS